MVFSVMFISIGSLRLFSLVYIFCLLIAFTMSCKSYDRKDPSGKSMRDYSAAISKNSADHEAFFHRAGIHLLHCSIGDEIDVVQPCLEDMEKAIQIAGESNAKAEYYYRRGYCRAAVVLNVCWWHTGRTDYQDWRSGFSPEQQKMLRQSVVDFDTAIQLAKRPQFLAVLFDRRAGVEYYLGEHHHVIADIAKLRQTVGDTPWEHEDAIFAAADPNHPPSMVEVNYQVSKQEELSCKKLLSKPSDAESADIPGLKGYCDHVNSRYLKNFSKIIIGVTGS